MLLAILRAILTWLTIGVPVALLVLWDALAAWRRGRQHPVEYTADLDLPPLEKPGDWRTWPAIWEAAHEKR